MADLIQPVGVVDGCGIGQGAADQVPRPNRDRGVELLAVVAKLKIESRSHRELYQMTAIGFANGHAESSVSC